MSTIRETLIAAGVLTAMAGCATQPDKIETAYVSPLIYKDYSCQQVAGELDRVSRRANELHGSLKKKADGDDGAMAVGMILFWPALFFLDGNSPAMTEYARLKGEREALEKVAIQKNCQDMPRVVEVPQGAPVPTSMPSLAGKSKEERLVELRRLREQGLISDEVYTSEQRRILAGQ